MPDIIDNKKAQFLIDQTKEINEMLLSQFLAYRDRVDSILQTDNIVRKIWDFNLFKMSYDKLSKEDQARHKEFYTTSMITMWSERLWRFNLAENERELRPNLDSINANIDMLLDLDSDFDFRGFDNEFLKKHIEDYLNSKN